MTRYEGCLRRSQKVRHTSLLIHFIKNITVVQKEKETILVNRGELFKYGIEVINWIRKHVLALLLAEGKLAELFDMDENIKSYLFRVRNYKWLWCLRHK